MVSRELEKECVVVFDEAHNIDNVCIEARAPCRPPGARSYSGMGPLLSQPAGHHSKDFRDSALHKCNAVVLQNLEDH